MFHAIESKNTEIVKILIDDGIDLNVCNRYGDTAKRFAENENLHDIVSLFPAEKEVYTLPLKYCSYNDFEDLVPGFSKED